MDIAFDHYTLALSVLDGEPDAHRLLADLLDEQGERGLARWARHGRSQYRTEMVLYLLPYPTVVEIGCDAATEVWKKWMKSREIPTWIAAIRGWAQAADGPDLDVALAELAAVAFAPYPHNGGYFDGVTVLQPSLQLFHGMLRSAQSARAAEQCGDERLVRARTHETTTTLRKMLKEGHPNPHWRIVRTRAALESLMGL